MEHTPAHERHNPDLLQQMPKDAGVLVEVGCSSGALAREYKKLNPHCRYIGIEIDADYAALAGRHCDEVIQADIETVAQEFLRTRLKADCWIFGDALEHLKDPWLLLSRIRKEMPDDGCIVACIPNAQHWSVQARLSGGMFRYEDSGLLDRTHLRWFTRTTINEMFSAAGFTVSQMQARVFDEPQRAPFMPAIKAMATAIGADPDGAINDALPLQYVIKATPA